MVAMRLLAAIALVFALSGSPAAAATAVIAPSADVGLPFWCDWGYDWEERCYLDDGRRLPVGGVDDKVWRGALRFSLGPVPAGAKVTRARLRLYFDGVCVAPRLAAARCGARGYTLDAHRILSADWFDEREVELDDVAIASTTLPDGGSPGWLTWDVTALVRAWHHRVVPNHGLLLKLAEEEEDFDVGGPYFPSSSFADPRLRPRLAVEYLPPG
jgi:hypothetical protein